MKMTNVKKSLSFFLCIVLIAVMALFTTGCSDNKETPDEKGSELSSQTMQETVTDEPESTDDGIQEIGTGKTKFTFTVTHNDGSTKTFLVSTDKKKVGEALVDNGIITGDEGAYGLYVKTVDGETLDYATDGKYWAFYVDSAYGATGVDLTDIADGVTYEFRAEK